MDGEYLRFLYHQGTMTRSLKGMSFLDLTCITKSIFKLLHRLETES